MPCGKITTRLPIGIPKASHKQCHFYAEANLGGFNLGQIRFGCG
jgi:hypothetical protein